MLVLRVQRSLVSSGKRAYHDIQTLPTSKPIVSSGPPGYSAVSGHTVTVFGCTGFLGRYLVSKIAKLGTQVIVPYRDEDEARVFKPMGDLGQIVRMEWDIRNEEQIAECVRHSDIVYNLSGRDYETKTFDFESVHVSGAERIASVAARSGVARFVHVSHLNASATSESKFYQTKALGEERVRAAFPNATIVRPGAMFGYEDKLLNSISISPWWWKLNSGKTQIRPVHVLDVAQALANLMPSSDLASRTLSLPGPSTLTHEYLLDLVSAVTLRSTHSYVPEMPRGIATQVAKLAQAVWWPLMSPDEVTRRYINDSEVAGDWEELGIAPSEVEPLALKYLRRYRTSETYTDPVEFPTRPSLTTA
ncbi:NAD(P)-bd-dom domain-containing protein [Mycena chlorophos]|uniref:NAD(P)-bd-dom domain-containing protein n=1 Tax=Mycena chlorophos TaxID=658473 RepID=A0A8H6S5B8_MYCCL|nr:NAD(P)-bd-dom domain-containing protein [Mycena chlorophos]